MSYLDPNAHYLRNQSSESLLFDQNRILERQSTLLQDQNKLLNKLLEKIGHQQKQEQSQPPTIEPLVFFSLLGNYNWRQLQVNGEADLKEGKYNEAFDRFCDAIKSAQNGDKSATALGTADLRDIFNLYVLAVKCQGYKFFNFMKPSLPVATGMILSYRVIKYFGW